MSILNDVEFEYNFEYRSVKDDAWYTCAIVLEEDGNRLHVKFQDFPLGDLDEVFSISDFSDSHAIEALVDRFRRVSVPVDDSECSRLIEGTKVCAIRRGNEEEVLYYDAIVTDAILKKHTPEKCLCTFFIRWQHGPDHGKKTSTPIEDICFIMQGDLDPKLTDFANLVKEKLELTSHDKLQVSDKVANSSHGGFSFSTGGAELTDHDKDLGGAKTAENDHYIVLENLEKDSCPVIMKDFIHEHTSITAETYVFPSLSAEPYARGAIVVDCLNKLKRIYGFINNPNHFITSCSGRPWVIAEDRLMSGTFNTNLQSLQPKYKYENYSVDKLKIVQLETEEYKICKTRKDLYLEFRNHSNWLMERLAMDEK